MVHAWNPSHSGCKGRRLSNLRPAQVKIARFCLKNRIKNKGLGASSIGRALALDVQDTGSILTMARKEGRKEGRE
jgi:hypothetical protein